MKHPITKTKEFCKLHEKGKTPVKPWEKWGPYLSNRSWGTVREDYSANGEAWDYFPFPHAHQRAFRWGEDGIAGMCDRYQIMALSFGFWNEKDPLIKERYFGLSSKEGNHGEDVKDYYFYIDATPSHSYLKCLYKYPQAEFPYQKLIEENKKRGLKDLEFELIDTGIFNEDNYFDIFIEYAKASEEDICVRVEVANRSSNPAPFHLLSQLVFRNRWSWGETKEEEPVITKGESGQDLLCLLSDDAQMKPLGSLPFSYQLGKRYFYGALENGEALFTNNETNKKALWNVENDSPYTKDGFKQKIIEKNPSAVNVENRGTKACLHYSTTIPAKSSSHLYFRWTDKPMDDPFSDIEKIFSLRKKQADEFYQSIHPEKASEEEKKIQRQALAGMIWSKQIYLYDVSTWLQGDNPKDPPPPSRVDIRNNHWRHLNSMRIFSMPDKWEYPWFAAWDLAFQVVVFSLIDLEFAKEQLWFLLFDQFLHPNGQVPAYEWNFCDVNPPVQAWSALKIFEREKEITGEENFDFLERCFHKLLLNFSWWINRVDQEGNNIFEGGFLGLDNICVLDRDADLPKGVQMDQTDGSGWMAMFCLNLMRISLVLSKKSSSYQALATKFFEHFVYIAAAMRKGYWRGYDMWDEQDGFFYSVLRYPNGEKAQIKIRTLVGLIPFYAVETLTEEEIKGFSEFHTNFHWFLKNRAHLTDKCIMTTEVEGEKRYAFTLMHLHEMKRLLEYVWNPEEFRSPYGIRSISKFHEKNPFHYHDQHISYEPGESLERIKGGNSNWRGPIWIPTNYLFIDSLRKIDRFLDGELKIQAGNEEAIDLHTMADLLSKAIVKLFIKDKQGVRPIYRNWEKFKDPNFSNHLLFFEHYHGDNGRGLGANHQTGWSGLVANLIEEIYKPLKKK